MKEWICVAFVHVSLASVSRSLLYPECMYHDTLFVSYVGYFLFEYYLMLERSVTDCFPLRIRVGTPIVLMCHLTQCWLLFFVYRAPGSPRKSACLVLGPRLVRNGRNKTCPSLRSGRGFNIRHLSRRAGPIKHLIANIWNSQQACI